MGCKAVLTHVVCLAAGAAVMFLFMTPAGVGAAGPVGNGDVNGDGRRDIADAVYLLSYLFAGGPEPVPCTPSSQGSLPGTGQTLCYSTGGEIVDCLSSEWPGQDGFYQAGCPMDERFVDNGDGTVTDRCTGLMWQQEAADVHTDGEGSWFMGMATWQTALKYCENLELAGYTDWRLPSLRELQGIADYQRDDPSIDPVFGAVSSWYWSSSTYVAFPDFAWCVHFRSGILYYGPKTHSYYVRAVRGGP